MQTKKAQNKQVAERIERIRAGLGLTVRAFCTEIGYNPGTYANHIGARATQPSTNLITLIANKWGINPNWILSGYGDVMKPGARRIDLFSGAGVAETPDDAPAYTPDRAGNDPLGHALALVDSLRQELAARPQLSFDERRLLERYRDLTPEERQQVEAVLFARPFGPAAVKEPDPPPWLAPPLEADRWLHVDGLRVS